MEDRRSIAKKAAIGVALVIAAAGAVLFYKNNIAMNPGDTLLKYMSYAEDGKYEKMYDLLNEESQKSISKAEHDQGEVQGVAVCRAGAKTEVCGVLQRDI